MHAISVLIQHYTVSGITYYTSNIITSIICYTRDQGAAIWSAYDPLHVHHKNAVVIDRLDLVFRVCEAYDSTVIL